MLVQPPQLPPPDTSVQLSQLLRLGFQQKGLFPQLRTESIKDKLLGAIHKILGSSPKDWTTWRIYGRLHRGRVIQIT